MKACYALGFGGFRACRRPAAELIALAIAGFVATVLYLHHTGG
jgi:hypothetical protein